jgi:hypothetical protein
MKRKKKEVRPMERGYILGSELSLEMEQAEELLQARIRNYCRRMAAVDQPLSFMSIIEDLQELEIYSTKLRKLLKSLNR